MNRCLIGWQLVKGKKESNIGKSGETRVMGRKKRGKKGEAGRNAGKDKEAKTG
jgi:hypothetical protein